MQFKQEYFIGISLGAVVLTFDIIYLYGTRWFFAALILAVNIGWLQFWLDFFKEIGRQKEVEQKFLEYVRALVSNVKSGLTIPGAIVHISEGDYGALTPHVRKLSNQISWGIPVHDALFIFAKDTKNSVIKRAIAIVIEAEKSGGDMENVLEAVTNSVLEVKKMKAERKSGTYSQIVQGYIVYLIFIGVMLMLQIKLFPLISDAVQLGGASFDIGSVIGEGKKANLDNVFFSLVMIQALFAGIIIGKFSEGTFKQGLLHSLILMVLASLIVTTVKGSI
jgi:archaeal flagellar protein FlaJ